MFLEGCESRLRWEQMEIGMEIVNATSDLYLECIGLLRFSSIHQK